MDLQSGSHSNVDIYSDDTDTGLFLVTDNDGYLSTGSMEAGEPLRGDAHDAKNPTDTWGNKPEYLSDGDLCVLAIHWIGGDACDPRMGKPCVDRIADKTSSAARLTRISGGSDRPNNASLSIDPWMSRW